MSEKKIYLVSLGCPKNLVDSELLLCTAYDRGWEIADDAGEADLLVVNTCGFIKEAREESMAFIRECLDVKRSRGGVKVVAAGCMAEMKAKELVEVEEQVDHVIGVGELEAMRCIVEGEAEMPGKRAEKVLFPDERHPRLLTGYGSSAYVKIGDGCSRKCAFCLIPGIRGKARSREPEAIVEEVQRLSEAGVKEVILVSQDTTSYGWDLGGGRASLPRLVEDVASVEGIAWIRILYLYPHESLHELFDVMGKHEAVVPYLDLPFQHASSKMLSIMRRGYDRNLVEELVAGARRQVPGLAIRTTLIAGHPGETDEDFRELLEFVDAHRFERIGVMRYSDEEGSASYRMGGKVSASKTSERCERLVDLASTILEEQNGELAGRRIEAMLELELKDAEGEGGRTWLGRLPTQAPEVDGVAIVRGVKDGRGPGSMIEAAVTGFQGADLHARALP